MIKLTSDDGKVRVNYESGQRSGEFVLALREEDIERRTRSIELNLQSRFLLFDEKIEDYQRRINDLEAVYWSESQELSDKILGPIAPFIDEKKIIIDAEGTMQKINFAALPRPNSEKNEPMITRNEVVYSRPLNHPTTPQHERSRGILVVADPVFSAHDDRIMGDVKVSPGEVRSTSGSMILRLPETSDEAGSIETLVGAENTTVLTGLAANRTQVLNSNLNAYSAIHFATHGLVDRDDPENSALLLSGFDSSRRSMARSSLRVSDIAGLALNADLVVLSGCETGRGKVVGKDMISLKTAFFNAGAKTVVSSLWKVDDAATKDLMAKFYRGIVVEGLTASAALRQAQIGMYNDPRYVSPFYWGAFTVQGDYQRVPSIGGGFPFWILSLLIAPIVIFVLAGKKAKLISIRS
ncbi:MAG: CHAT domain-containing protein [Pyrinomonadaceae bacterium]